MRRISFHPAVFIDVDRALRHYTEVAGEQIAQDFFAELLEAFGKAEADPTRFSTRETRHRRVNLERFPYHVLFRFADDEVRITVVRHNRRAPSFGTRRK